VPSLTHTLSVQVGPVCGAARGDHRRREHGCPEAGVGGGRVLEGWRVARHAAGAGGAGAAWVPLSWA